jgi:MFS family permease
MLIGARFVQGIGGALTSAVILGMIVTMFPEPREQAKAIGVYGFVASAGGTIGLLIGGVLTEAIAWHWIFFINLPVGVATAVMARRLISDAPGLGFGQGADILGAVLITSGLMLGTYTILGVEEHGWAATRTLVLGGISLILETAFIVRQARIANPLMPLRLFRSRNVSGANALQALLVAGMFGMFFLGALYMQQILDYDPLEVGLAFLPATLVMGTLSLGYSEKLIMRFGPRTMLIPGMVLIGLALLLFARTPVDGSYLADILPPMLLIGVGIGISFPSLMTVAMSGATPEDAGLASGWSTPAPRSAARSASPCWPPWRPSAPHPARRGTAFDAALNSGFHLAYVVGAGLVAVALAIAIFVLRSEPLPEHGEQPAGEEPHAGGAPAYSEG